MSWINRLEARFGRFAIPNLVQTLAFFQLLVFGILGFMPGYVDVLAFDPDRVMGGQVWRLVSWILVPRYGSILWAVIGTMFAVFMGNHLEHAWGSFRTTLFIAGSGLVLVVTAWLLRATGLVPNEACVVWSGFFSFWVFSSLFLSFCVLFPDLTIQLYFFIPIKLKWLGLISGALMLAQVVDSPDPMRLLILAAHVGFLGFAVPLAARQLKQRQKVAVRRAKFDRGLPDDDDVFHTCERCGKNDRDHPNLEFRVTADDRELCTACLAESSAGGGR
jgi:hypothetical protein